MDIMRRLPPPLTACEEEQEAKRIVIKICEAFSSNFLKSETDMALLITEKFTLRAPNTEVSHGPSAKTK